MSNSKEVVVDPPEKVKESGRVQNEDRTNEFEIINDFDKNTVERSEYCHPSSKFEYPPLQPDVQEDFPTEEGEKPRIPHIIHQTFKDENIPSIYWDNIKTVREHHPTWKYYFWTDASARQLVADRFPNWLSMWDRLRLGIKRADALRYFILYEYGGVYLDLDFEVVRPLDNTTTKYAGIIAPEPFEHAAFLYEKEFILMNCFMSSRPRHPFFKHLMDQLPKTYFDVDLIKATGPLFVTSQYLSFYNISVADSNRTKVDCRSNSPYFYKGKLSETDENAIYIPNTHYFNDIIDVRYNHEERFNAICNNSSVSFLRKRACSDMKRRGVVRTERPYAYTNHKWSHFWLESRRFDTKSIHNLVENCFIYPQLDNV